MERRVIARQPENPHLQQKQKHLLQKFLLEFEQYQIFTIEHSNRNPSQESSCSRDIVDQPKVSAGKEGAGGGQFGAEVPEGLVVPSHCQRA